MATFLPGKFPHGPATRRSRWPAISVESGRARRRTFCQAGAVDPAELGASAPLPDPALVVLVGASGAGKSVWAAEHYRPDEVVSSDRLRALVGSGEHDLDASADAFALLDHIVAARTRRGLTAVVDTLGLDQARRVRAATMWSSRANASSDASRSCSPLPTSARSRSDEITSSGR